MMISASFKNALKKNGFSGEIHFDLANRILNSTDNSIYEILPIGVIQPRNTLDLQILAQVAGQVEFATLAFTPRGGGTGTNAQSLNKSIIVDTSRFMTEISELSVENKTVTVEPGVVLSELNRYLAKSGLMFAPNISTADRATIGGMIATDAAGKGSLVYGKTSDHIKSIKTVLINGEIFEFSKLNCADLDHSDSEDKLTQLHTQIKDLIDPLQDEINKVFPEIKRPLSGYDLKRCYANDSLDLTKLIAGSEGTLCFIAKATLKLVEIPKYKSLVVVHYDNFLESLKDAQSLIEYSPMAIEVIDEKIQNNASGLPDFQEISAILNSPGTPSIANFVELAETSQQALENKVNNIVAALEKRGTLFAVINDPVLVNKVLRLRSLAVGVAANIKGKQKPIAFVEDAMVPPQYLHDFVADLKTYLDSLNLQYAMYGHTDVGCIHVRPLLDMQNKKDQDLIRPITEKVLELTDKYHGLLWGEHGKGVRGEFVKHTFGDKLYQVMALIKKLFDPDNRLNPGKLVNPDGNIDTISKIDELPLRGNFDRIVANDTQNKYKDAFLCNGNASCFNQDSSNVMCPSYKVTKNRIHSPKGRASLVKAWIRSIAIKDTAQEKELATEVFNTLDECLGCKSCTGKCPVQVSIPELKSKFLDYYYANYRKRNLKEFMNGYLEHVLVLAMHFPKVWNFMVKNKLLPRLGMVDVPLLAKENSFKNEALKLDVQIYTNLKQLDRVKNPVIILSDVFSTLVEKNILNSTVKVLKNLGFTPLILKPKISGKALLNVGFINKFKFYAKKWHKLLNPIFAKGVAVIGLESSTTLVFRDEMPKFYEPLSGRVETLAEFLTKMDVSLLSKNSRPENLKIVVDKESNDLPSKTYTLLPHCSEQALLPLEQKNWQKIFKNIGLDLEIKVTGCCGMSGLYGHEEKHLENSQNLFKRHWQPILENKAATYLATGYSCRSQTSRFNGDTLLHPIEALALNV